MIVAFTVPGSPQGKARPRFVRATGRAYTPAKTVNYEATVKMAAQAAMQGRAPLVGTIAVTISALFPVPGSWSAKKRDAALTGNIRPTVKPDADNIAKVCDALNGVVFVDDKQVVVLIVGKHYSTTPGVQFHVEEFTP